MDITIFLAVIGILYLMYLYLTHVYGYWKNKNIPGPTPVFLLGNAAEVAQRKKDLSTVVTAFYNEYPHERFVGVFQGRSPLIIARHLEDIKQVLIKDFSNFSDRGLRVFEGPLSKNLFHTEGESWRLLRQRLTPIFTSGKLKSMFHLMDECLENFQGYLDRLVSENAEPEIRQLMAKLTLEMFGTCVLGINMRTIGDEDNIFRDIGAKIFKPKLKVSITRSIDSIFPGIFKHLGINQHEPEVVDFFMNLVNQLIKEREGKPKVRKDFMDLLIELKEQGHIAGEKMDLEITDTLMAAQAFIFYAAGFETSSGTMAFLIHELALNQDIQEKVYEEISGISDKYSGKLTYEALQEMKYLDMVLSETMRKYPTLGILVRMATSNYTFPGSKLTIDKGIKVLIPVYALHHDPQYFPDPDKFIPERFSPENRDNIQQCSYLPFGEGPRNCIGSRFARVQTMVGVASLLLRYKVVPTVRTRSQLRFEPKASTLQSRDGIWVKIQRR